MLPSVQLNWTGGATRMPMFTCFCLTTRNGFIAQRAVTQRQSGTLSLREGVRVWPWRQAQVTRGDFVCSWTSLLGEQ